MKKYILILVLFLCYLNVNAQNYNNIVNYSVNGTPTYGVKIKTNLPFTTNSQMPTITIQGFNYGAKQTIGLQIGYYIYTRNTPPELYFPVAKVSSFGSFTPQIILANESGKLVIFLDDRSYYIRFTVSVFSQGLNVDGAPATAFQGWTAVDEALTGTNQMILPYNNQFSGTVNMPGDGVWDSTGSVGIGIHASGTYKLAVKGKVHAQQVNVDLDDWGDYVFDPFYHLPSLGEVKTYIDKNHHLPEVPTTAEIKKNGLDVGEMNKILVKKMEEMTLYLIEKNRQLNEQQKINNRLELRLKNIERTLKKKNNKDNPQGKAPN